jgi:hypothetical protein
METMHASEAREHIEMVEAILSRTERCLNVGGEFFIVWGLFSAAVDLFIQLVLTGRLSAGTLWVLPVLFAAAVAFSIVRGRQLKARACGISHLQREFFTVLGLALALAAIVNLAAFNLFTEWANSAIWTVAGIFVLFFIALHGNRRALAGGIIMVGSLIAANFMHGLAGYALAAGMLFGYSGFGLVSLLSHD